MTPFEPDGVYCSIPYRVLPDSSIEAMMPSGFVKFKNIDHFLASSDNASVNTDANYSIISYDSPGDAVTQNSNVPAPVGPLDYDSMLLAAINKTKYNSAQLRALVYDRARFNLKRDILYSNSSIGLADLVRQLNEFELAVARVEANAADDQPSQPASEQAELLKTNHATSSNAVQILPPRPITPQYAKLSPTQWTDNFRHAQWPEEFLRYVRSANRFIGFALLGMAFIGTFIIAVTLWHSPKVSPKIEIANKLPQTGETTIKQSSPSEDDPALIGSSPKVPILLPTSFGIYVLSDNKLTELEALPINIPDPRIALSAEIKKPSTVTISDGKPAFIIFRRDLLNNAPQKVLLRVIARVARETKIVNGKAEITKIEGAWRIRDISRELKISPVAGQREMVIARLDDGVSLAPGRFALVLNRVGYDFTINGPVQAPDFCLERFEATNGSVFTQCRTP